MKAEPAFLKPTVNVSTEACCPGCPPSSRRAAVHPLSAGYHGDVSADDHPRSRECRSAVRGRPTPPPSAGVAGRRKGCVKVADRRPAVFGGKLSAEQPTSFLRKGVISRSCAGTPELGGRSTILKLGGPQNTGVSGFDGDTVGAAHRTPARRQGRHDSRARDDPDRWALPAALGVHCADLLAALMDDILALGGRPSAFAGRRVPSTVEPRRALARPRSSGLRRRYVLAGPGAAAHGDIAATRLSAHGPLAARTAPFFDSVVVATLELRRVRATARSVSAARSLFAAADVRRQRAPAHRPCVGAFLAWCIGARRLRLGLPLVVAFAVEECSRWPGAFWCWRASSTAFCSCRRTGADPRYRLDTGVSRARTSHAIGTRRLLRPAVAVVTNNARPFAVAPMRSTLYLRRRCEAAGSRPRADRRLPTRSSLRRTEVRSMSQAIQQAGASVRRMPSVALMGSAEGG